MDTAEQNNLTTAPIPSLIRQIAIPASIGFFFNTMYNIVDTFWAGRLGSEALAAVGLSFPVFFVIIALGTGISTGATALMGNALGKDDEAGAKNYFLQALSFTAIISLFLMAAGIASASALFKLLGASGEYLQMAVAYINPIFFSAFFFLLTFVLNSVLTARGNTAVYRNLLIISFFLNVILDPWFMYGGWGLPALGLPGVAWATAVIQVSVSVVLAIYIYKKGLFHSEVICRFCPRLRAYREIASQGFPASLNMLTVAIGVFVITYYISSFGEKAVAAYGIATRIEQMAVLPNIGLTIAALTLAAQNNGARKFDRVVTVFRTALKYALWLLTPGALMVFLFASPLMRIFTPDPEVVAVGVSYLKIAAFIFWGYGILFITVSFLQGLKRPAFGAWIGLYRQIMGPVLIFPLLAHSFGLGLFGVWAGIFFLVWSSVIVAYFYAGKVLEQIKNQTLEKVRS